MQVEMTTASINKALRECGGVKRYITATPYTIHRVTRVRGGWAWWIRFPDSERKIVHSEAATLTLYTEAVAQCNT